MSIQPAYVYLAPEREFARTVDVSASVMIDVDAEGRPVGLDGSPGGARRAGEAEDHVRCMPWPLAVLCWLDNRKGPHSETAGLACRAHDAVMICWWKRLPAWEARFSRRLLS